MPDEREAHEVRPRCLKRELLATSDADLPAGLGVVVAQACAETPWVRAAYLCRVRREYDADGNVREELSAFVLADPPLEKRLTTPAQRIALLEQLPESMQAGGLSVLADAAVSDVKQLGFCVYEQQ